MERVISIIQGEALLMLGTLLIVGYLVSIVTRKIGLPEISGYIIAGLLLGDSFLGIINHHSSIHLATITEIALAMIALTIGGEFLWKKIKALGMRMVIITAVQVLFAFGFVLCALYVVGLPLAISMLLGSVAAATAPAATVAIIQSLNIKGEFVDYLYGVVALDDAATIILFGVVSALIASIGGSFGVGGMSVNALTQAFFELFFSITLGVAGGYILHIACARIRIDSILTIIGGGITLLIAGLAHVFHLSPLLTTMVSGAVLVNISRRNQKIFRSFAPFAPAIYALFFIIAGGELQLDILLRPEVLLLGGVYIGARGIGKYTGVFVGSMITNSPHNIRNWLGICMLPQAGVALGLIVVIQGTLAADISLVDQYLQSITSVVLFSVFVNELIGPPFSKLAIVKGSHTHT